MLRRFFALKVLSVSLLSSLAMAASDKPKCALTAIEPFNPPTVTIYPVKSLDPNEEILIVFRTPSPEKGRQDEVKSYKIKDHDGSVNTMLLMYLSQGSTIERKEIDTKLIASLRKRAAYFKAKKEKNPDAPEATLIDTSLSMTDFLLVKKDGFTDKDYRSVITDILGPMTDYDETTVYEYKEFKDGQFVSQPAKRLKDIFPEEFYATASSTATGGLLDTTAPGRTTCDFKPILGGKEQQPPPTVPSSKVPTPLNLKAKGAK